jgi:RNA-directed DNA polymerase
MDGPGDRAPKRLFSREPTRYIDGEGHVVPPTSVDVASTVPPGSYEFGTSRMPLAREPGGLTDASSSVVGDRQLREGETPQSAESTSEESDAVVVPEKSAKMRVTPFESMEERTAAKGKVVARNASLTQGRKDASTHLQRLGERAKKKPKDKWTNLLSHIRAPLLAEAYARLRKHAATGVDQVTWEEYGERLGERLLQLQDRVHRGSYHPQPVRRVHIPKGDGRTRPLGVPALEDKIVQQAVRMVLEPIYEAEFIGFSYGFRPRRSAHDALDALATAIERKVSWVLDADIRSFYDTIDHGWLQQFLEHRIGDARMVRLLMKWTKAGVMEEGKLYAVTEGTPQGGIISPLLANIYLHYVLDLWVAAWRKKPGRGEVYVVRYADDFVLALQKEQDARLLIELLQQRMAKFGLELHSEKTRLIQFGRFAREDRERRGQGRPETFEFLGFVHVASASRAGKFLLRRRTSGKKMRAKLASLKEESRHRRHWQVIEQYNWLCSVLRGHYRYYGVPTNHRSLVLYRRRVQRMWHAGLQRRSQRGRWTRARQVAFEERYRLPLPKICHPWPTVRFRSPLTQGGSPVRENRTPGSVRGAAR